MKSIITTLLIILLFGACSKTPKNYATVSGQISNPNKLNKITISNRAGFSREIKVNEDGTFSDTLKVEEGIYRFFDGKEMGSIFLKNNNTISLSLDTNAFDETLKFKGDGADKSNFIITKSLLQEKYLTDDVFNATENEFLETFDDLYVAYNALKEQYPLIDTAYFEVQDKGFESMKKAYTNYFEGKIEMRKLFAKGTPSPTFSNYENDNGSKSSLSDFRGKFVYIDVWATWCGPCIQQIPYLKKLEDSYKNKNIEFVSISTDESRRNGGSWEAAEKKWRDFVKAKQMGGIQLWSGKDFSFQKAYKINGIPRFILVDPKGNIVDANAPRPSEPRLTELFTSLGI